MSSSEQHDGSGASKKSVDKQIRQLELDIARRQRLIALRGGVLTTRIQNKTASPSILLIAAAGGFLLDRLTRNKPGHGKAGKQSTPEQVAAEPPSNTTVVLQVALELLTLLNMSESSRNKTRN